jgi:phenylacetate-CoA ligase
MPHRLSIRALAYDLAARRDGLSGWKRGRDEFRALAASPRSHVDVVAQRRLAALLMHAALTVPHYRDAWRRIGFTPSRKTTVHDLARLPMLTKAQIREGRARLVSDVFDRSGLVPALTGGTTGTQTEFFRDRQCDVRRAGRQWGILERCGYAPGDRRGLLWGVHTDLPSAGSGAALKRWFRRLASPEEILCCTRMTPDDMIDFHARLRRSRPSVMYAYPRALEEFARFVRDNRLVPLAFQRVICTAEALRPDQRELFSREFGAEVFNLYCSREHGCVAFECGRHDRLHIDAGSVIVEILRDGHPVPPGVEGEIVITDLMNYGMPFIRYATGDLAVASDAPCGCGLAFPTLSRLCGRTADMIHLPDGTAVAGVMLADLLADEPSITFAQFVQDEPDLLNVNIVVNGAARAGLHAAVEAEVRTVVGAAVRIRVNQVEDISRNPRSGKYQDVISRCAPRAVLA